MFAHPQIAFRNCFHFDFLLDYRLTIKFARSHSLVIVLLFGTDCFHLGAV